MQNLEELISNGKIEEAVAQLNHLINTGNADDCTYFTLGKLLWRLGRRSEAMDAYNEALSLNPDSPAAVAIEQGKAIFDFFNPDLLNP